MFRLSVESHFLIDHTSVGLSQAHCNYNAVVMYVHVEDNLVANMYVT